MVELQVVTQVLIIVILALVAACLVYLLIMLHKINKKLTIILEILSIYEQAKSIYTDLVNGPGKAYFDIAKNVFSTVLPLLTNKRKTK